MSYLIQGNMSAMFRFQQLTQNKINQSKNASHNYHKKLYDKPLFDFKSHIKSNNTLYKTIQGKNKIIFYIGVHKIYPKLNAILKMVYDKSTHKFYYHFALLTGHYRYVRIENKDRRIIACKEISKRSYQDVFSLHKILINMSNGVLLLQVPNYSFIHQSKLQQIINHAEVMIRKTRLQIFSLREPINFIKQLANCHDDNNYHPQFINKTQDNKFKKIQQYTKMIFTKIRMDESYSKNIESSIILNRIDEEKSIETILSRIVGFDKNNFKNVYLYQIHHQSLFQNTKIQDLELNFLQREQGKKKLEMPNIVLSKNPYQTTSILNYIKIKDNEVKRLGKVGSGGFSKIQYATVQFWYLISQSYELNVFNMSQEFSEIKKQYKYVAIKRQNRDLYKSNRINRIQHEKNILSKIKNGKPIYFPRYYIPKFTHQFEYDLILDYIDYPSFKEYHDNNSETISLQTKIHLAFTVVQALRYLRSYGIVHLDCKPSNILLYKNMLIKLIDFGESFHEEVCGQSHTPGITIPYSAPENYSMTSHFTEKNDVFSIGVILYEQLFKRFPFFPQQESTFKQCYVEREFMNYWFCTPQDLISFGDSRILPVLQLLITRCLQKDPANRPELDWIALILRQCREYFS